MTARPLQIAIAANFFAVELRDALSPYLTSVNLPHQLTFTPYNSLIEQLLRTDGAVSGATCVVILIQLERLFPHGETISTKDGEFFVQAFRTVVNHPDHPPVILIVCPHSICLRSNVELGRLEETLCKEFTGREKIDIISTSDFFSYHPSDEYDDYFDGGSSYSSETPYSQLCYAMFASVTARHIYRRFREPRKVIVVDCDGTLWSGNCGELGPFGVQITDGHRALQETLIRQSKGGQLICLCSRNNEVDVLSVFDQHPDMVLKREHLTSHRINWSDKPQNIRSLVEELHLDSGSFIFLDDDSFQCDAVRKLIPDVQVIEIPSDENAIKTTLKQIWDLDPRMTITKEDRGRQLYYKQHAARERERETALTLEEFIESLDLKVTIACLQPADIDRAEQLMRRVNQFNLNGIRYSGLDLQCFAANRNYRCFSARVADRFGDYGLVGVMIYEIATEQLKVRSLLLSCRALGKGVERCLAAHLCEQAQACAAKKIRFEFCDTFRNRPMRVFIDQFGAIYDSDGAIVSVDAG